MNNIAMNANGSANGKTYKLYDVEGHSDGMAGLLHKFNLKHTPLIDTILNGGKLNGVKFDNQLFNDIEAILNAYPGDYAYIPHVHKLLLSKGATDTATLGEMDAIVYATRLRRDRRNDRRTVHQWKAVKDGVFTGSHFSYGDRQRRKSTNSDGNNVEIIRPERMLLNLHGHPRIQSASMGGALLGKNKRPDVRSTTLAQLKQTATRLQLKGRSSMNKAQLVAALRKHRS